ncbi:hypothetical protein F511_08545 [Dorcoceras hygrometricum]|uniref:PHD-type domain-containing protein n=1 Tax=Dorcoceras hygrometricum TaxID=472368 RepID=A0A2Z7D082_9LAMI|nr:hypothetical protein F511_08545 [Dorcoceras hygrometricum]
MRLPRSESGVNIGKDKKFSNKLKGKKKHKRLDAICEESYNRSRQEVQNIDSNDRNDTEKELELRRSSRARRAPVLLDSSPQPPKKRRKVHSHANSIEKVRRESSRDLDGQKSAWGSRLRFKGKWASFSGSSRVESSLRGKRKLFDDFDGFGEDMEIQCNDKKMEPVDEKSTIVKSKRPGRIKASNVLSNDKQEIGLADAGKDDVQCNRVEDFEVANEGDMLHMEIKSEVRSGTGINNGNLPSDLSEGGVAAVQKESDLGEFHNNVDVEILAENTGIENLACDIVPEQQDIDEASSDQAKDDGHHDKPPEDETYENLNGKENALDDVDRKPRIKLGRRCGLCGGGTDGKPPNLLAVDVMGSDNEAYSGSSASDDYSYDVWDGFGDESGWLGRLLGPINDRLGIAGIWVHQQCAVWSPEVYFAGLGCLKNVRAALYRGRMLKCNRCKRPGATIGCRVDRCPKTYHLPCARAKGCIFDHRKFLIACTDHRHLFQPHGVQNARRLKKIKAKKMRLDLRKMSNDAYRKDIEVEEKWLENCGEDEEFLKRESKRLYRDLWRIAPVYIGGNNSEKRETLFEGWESVAGLQHVIQCMKEVVILPLLYPEYFKNLGLSPPRGVLLHGYPGTGKTLVVRALVGSCARGNKRIAYFARKGADCLGKYVGDSERQLRLLFQVAEKCQPSIIFFDEIDGLAPCRSKRQDQTHSSVVSTLLALMDGLKSRGSVIVIGATNRPEAVDPALRRPGRFDREIYFPLPLMKDREAILSLHTRKWPKPIGGSLLKWVAMQTVGFAGADLQALCTQAAIIALKRSFPLQEVLLAAETSAAQGQFPTIPSILVEDGDWLQAFSCAPPPCSQREGGIVVNDVVSSPLDTHLTPCLLQPLTRLLVLLNLDERIWLPLPLSKASTLVKNVIVSALDRRSIPSDNWWSHVDDLLLEVNVIDEIMNNLSLVNMLVGENEFSMGSHTLLQRNMSYSAYNKSGFHMLISGNPRSGQRHLASCLLHCFVGNVDIWKVDPPSISQEGHGDMVHGLTQILMRCAGAHVCMIYMPRIDLWAIEMCNEARGGKYGLPQSPENFSLAGKCEIDMEHDMCPFKVSYLWTLLIEQVESVCVNTSLIILATSELPLSLLPHRVRLFFESDISCGILGSHDHKVPQFSVQLDQKFDHDKVVSTFVARLSKEMVRHIIVSVYGRTHIRRFSLVEKTNDMVLGGVDRVCDSKSSAVRSLSPVPFINKTIKGKSGLLFTISVVGYQILCFPHFAELCWVTSKLKEGPHANVTGPWKNWPFNSCILRPINSSEKAVAASGSSNIRSRESGLVRGLIAIGLSAYRGEYTSLREVCYDVRKVLEILVERIDNKVKAGKDRSQFIRLLSQVAYLEDMMFSWAYTLQSLEVDPCVSAATTKVCLGSLDSDVCKHSTSHGDGMIMNGPTLLEDSQQDVAAREGEPTDTTTIYGNRLDAGDEVVVDSGKEYPHQVVLDPPSQNKNSLPPNDINLECPEAEIALDKAEFGGKAESFKHSNGFAENGYNILLDGHCDSGEEHRFEVSSVDATNLPRDLPSTDVNILCKDTGLMHSCCAGDSVTCFYRCCPDCVVNLQNLLLENVKIEWEHEGSDTTLEDVHDFLSSFAANLHSTLCKLSVGEISCAGRTPDKCQKQLKCQQCKNTEPKLMNCGGHAKTEKVARTDHSRISSGLNFSFVVRDGVLVNLDEGMVASYHCKFEKLCLCFLIEWLLTSKQKPFD